MARITKASLEEFAKEVAVLEAAEATILSRKEMERYSGGRYGAYTTLGTSQSDHEAHALAGLEHDLLSTEVGFESEHVFPIRQLSYGGFGNSLEPSGCSLDGSGFLCDDPYFTGNGSGYSIELGEVVVRGKKKKKKKNDESSPVSIIGGGGGFIGTDAPFNPKEEKKEEEKNGKKQTEEDESYSLISSKYDTLFGKNFHPQLRFQIESILENCPTLSATLEWQSTAIRLHFKVGKLGRGTIAQTAWTSEDRNVYIIINENVLDAQGLNFSEVGNNNNIFYEYHGDVYERLVGTLMHEALHVMHYRQIQHALNFTGGNISRAYEYLKEHGYTQEFLKIFFEGAGDRQIFNFNRDREHVYIFKYDHEAISEAIREYRMFLKRQ